MPVWVSRWIFAKAHIDVRFEHKNCTQFNMSLEYLYNHIIYIIHKYGKSSIRAGPERGKEDKWPRPPTLKNFEKSFHLLKFPPYLVNITNWDWLHKFTVPGPHFAFGRPASVHASTGQTCCFWKALPVGRQPTFSNTSILRTISFSNHQAIQCRLMGIWSKIWLPDALLDADPLRIWEEKLWDGNLFSGSWNSDSTLK